MYHRWYTFFFVKFVIFGKTINFLQTLHNKMNSLMFYKQKESRNEGDRDGSDTASSKLGLSDFSDEYELGS